MRVEAAMACYASKGSTLLRLAGLLVCPAPQSPTERSTRVIESRMVVVRCRSTEISGLGLLLE